MKLFWLHVDLVEDFMKMTLFEQKISFIQTNMHTTVKSCYILES